MILIVSKCFFRDFGDSGWDAADSNELCLYFL